MWVEEERRQGRKGREEERGKGGEAERGERGIIEKWEKWRGIEREWEYKEGAGSWRKEEIRLWRLYFGVK
jgi:hypothetical protein